MKNSSIIVEEVARNFLHIVQFLNKHCNSSKTITEIASELHLKEVKVKNALEFYEELKTIRKENFEFEISWQGAEIIATFTEEYSFYEVAATVIRHDFGYNFLVKLFMESENFNYEDFLLENGYSRTTGHRKKKELQGFLNKYNIQLDGRVGKWNFVGEERDIRHMMFAILRQTQVNEWILERQMSREAIQGTIRDLMPEKLRDKYGAIRQVGLLFAIHNWRIKQNHRLNQSISWSRGVKKEEHYEEFRALYEKILSPYGLTAEEMQAEVEHFYFQIIYSLSPISEFNGEEKRNFHHPYAKEITEFIETLEVFYDEKLTKKEEVYVAWNLELSFDYKEIFPTDLDIFGREFEMVRVGYFDLFKTLLLAKNEEFFGEVLQHDFVTRIFQFLLLDMYTSHRVKIRVLVFSMYGLHQTKYIMNLLKMLTEVQLEFVEKPEEADLIITDRKINYDFPQFILSFTNKERIEQLKLKLAEIEKRKIEERRKRL
ncbi:Mga helix-turn-helix domain-containing protein [Pilibacter termitis]|uniref:Mga helix-turn-helix domain-containing protein n=1 Tax=Pilibacter termitis TaxID=263852 RepID=A0A1T4PW66_9ENTE|nr:helix-turn-helix domain-containing protein [Pilibacter termitis]SJZ95616.1 Mga helix-turn-helix domain-containing protein [Pilibacter termitis]